MPFKIHYTEDGGVLLNAVGRRMVDDMLDMNRKIYANEEKIRAIKYQLCDLIRVEGGVLTAQDVELVAEQDKQAAKINPNIIVAVVSTMDIAYGLARMWQAYVDQASFETGVFRSMEEARKWLNSKLPPNNRPALR